MLNGEVLSINDLDRLGLSAFAQRPKGLGKVLGVSLRRSLSRISRGLRCIRPGYKRWPPSCTQHHTTPAQLTPGSASRRCQCLCGRWSRDWKASMHATIGLLWKAQRPRAQQRACRWAIPLRLCGLKGPGGCRRGSWSWAGDSTSLCLLKHIADNSL